MSCVRWGAGYVTFSHEAERDWSMDLRTKKGREEEIRAQVREFGGFSIFWVTSNKMRAQAADRLVERGELIRIEGHHYPWCGWRLRYE